MGMSRGPCPKQSCSRCSQSSLGLPSPSAFLSQASPTAPRLHCLYCAYFPEYLKKPDLGDGSFNLYDVPLSWKGKYTHCRGHWLIYVGFRGAVWWGAGRIGCKNLIDEQRIPGFLGVAGPLVWGKAHSCLGLEARR